MSNLSDRQLILLEKLKAEHSLSIDAVRRQFAISPASVYRDFRALIQQAGAVKARRGIRLAPPPAAAEAKQANCAFCSGNLNERSSFILQFKDGSQQKACCAHCGLMALGNAGVTAALTCDFLYGRMINARQAVFLLESAVNLCCQPSVLSFANLSDAQQFQTGFGGLICSLDEAVKKLERMMSINSNIPAVV